jgi:hypothetical protein
MKMSNYLLTIAITDLALVLSTAAILFLFGTSVVPTSDINLSAFAQEPSISSRNESNRVLGAIASNLWASNPDMMIGGYHPPIFNASESKPDVPAKEKGFLVADEKDFKISYPSNWIKNIDLNKRLTGVHSTSLVSFLIPDFDSTTSKSSWVGIAKYVIGGNHTTSSSLSDYVKEELNELESDVSFQLNESGPITLGGNDNSAHKIVYTTNVIDSSPASGALIMGHRKTMEIITINNGAAYFFVYSANAGQYSTYFPYIKKMIDSFEFK